METKVNRTDREYQTPYLPSVVRTAEKQFIVI